MRKLLLTLLLILPTSIGFAQGTTSRISGTVTDTSGAAVPSASVIAVNDDTGIVYNTKTSSSGTYSFDSLQLGKYTIRLKHRASAVRFYRQRPVHRVLTSADPRLEAGGNSETVTIQGGYDMVQTESSGNFGAIIDNVTLTELPIVGTRGRNPLGLTQFIPGVIQNNSANAPGGDIVVTAPAIAPSTTSLTVSTTTKLRPAVPAPRPRIRTRTCSPNFGSSRQTPPQSSAATPVRRC